MLESVKQWAQTLKRDVVALWFAARDPRVPLVAKLLAGAVAAYALSPIDLIPDFIPVLGYVDDLLIVPLGIWAAIKLTPPELLNEFRERANAHGRPKSLAGAAVIVAIWLVLALAAAAFVWQRVAK